MHWGPCDNSARAGSWPVPGPEGVSAPQASLAGRWQLQRRFVLREILGPALPFSSVRERGPEVAHELLCVRSPRASRKTRLSIWAYASTFSVPIFSERGSGCGSCWLLAVSVRGGRLLYWRRLLLLPSEAPANTRRYVSRPFDDRLMAPVLVSMEAYLLSESEF